MHSIGVIGAGQMGGGIAQVSAQAGFHVYLADREQAIADKAKAGIEKALARAVDKGRLEAEAAAAALARIEPVGGFEPMPMPNWSSRRRPSARR